MARIRKTDERKSIQNQHIWKVGKYIRLSREDGNEVSESVVNQDRILTDALPGFFEDGRYELVDTYVDDGTSGTTDLEREAFQRMVRDVETGRINCIIVKNLSRAFRNSANQGKFLEEFIPLYHTRFISLYQPRLDTFLDPEIVHSLEVSITGFMNEQYAYKTSCDVRRTFKIKREKGEFIGAFAPYGYAKDPENRNLLVVDEEAAEVVRNIYRWFAVDGMSKTGVAQRLNGLGIPNPTAYKRGKGLRYNGRNAGKNDGLWAVDSVSRILQNPVYIGTLQQGKQRMVSYKVHKSIHVPERDWFVVEDAVPPVIDRKLFDAAQDLHGRDTRTPSNRQEPYLFSGFLRCADCGKSMKRRTAGRYVYYGCSTYERKSKTACTLHTIRLDQLEQAVLVSIQKQIALMGNLAELVEEIDRTPVERKEFTLLTARLEQQRGELAAVSEHLDDIYLDWKNGDITQEQYRRMRARFEEQAAKLRGTVEHLERECAAAENVNSTDPYLTDFLKHRNIQSLSRGLLIELVDAIYVHEGGAIDIVFKYADPYRRIAAFIESNQDVPCAPGDKVG